MIVNSIERKGQANNAVRRLALLSRGMVFLDAEDYGKFAGDPDYCQNKKRV